MIKRFRFYQIIRPWSIWISLTKRRSKNQACNIVTREENHTDPDILTICIGKKYRKKGAGKLLLGAGETEIIKRGADIVFLDVAEDNPGAIALYRNAGYVQHGRRSGYYRRPGARIGALLFQKRLKLPS